MGQGRPLGTANDMVGGLTLALHQHVGLADGVGLGINLLAEQIGLDLFTMRCGQPKQRLFRKCQHAPGPGSAVIKLIGTGLYPVCDGEKDQVGHQLDRVTRGPVLSGLLVVVFVEFTDQFLEDGAHGMVVHSRELDRPVIVQYRVRTKVYIRIHEFFDQ